MLPLPEPRGPLSERVLDVVARAPHDVGAPPAPRPADPLGDDDLHLALYLLYELHYRGLPGADERWEWEPSLLALRRALEDVFEAGLRDAVPHGATADGGEMDLAIRAIADADAAPSVSRHLERSGTREQLLEFMAHRSPFQLKEADTHSWAIPRLTGRAKAALVEIQVDEYGGGDAERIHAELFARSMRALGMDSRYGALLHHVPGTTLATVNLMSLCGLHRRLRGAIVGHLALYETTSAVGSRRCADALRRLGFGPDATEFFDEHVEADAIHESIALVDMAGGLVLEDPSLGPDVLWGARALVELDGRWARAVTGAWEAGRSSLRTPLPAPAGV